MTETLEFAVSDPAALGPLRARLLSIPGRAGAAVGRRFRRRSGFARPRAVVSAFPDAAACASAGRCCPEQR